MIYYLQEDDQNWQNSEVMSIFAASLTNQGEEAVNNLQTNEASMTSSLTIDFDKPTNFEEITTALATIDSVVEALKKIASEHDYRGDMVLANNIEQTINEILDISYKIQGKDD